MGKAQYLFLSPCLSLKIGLLTTISLLAYPWKHVSVNIKNWHNDKVHFVQQFCDAFVFAIFGHNLKRRKRAESAFWTLAGTQEKVIIDKHNELPSILCTCFHYIGITRCQIVYSSRSPNFVSQGREIKIFSEDCKLAALIAFFRGFGPRVRVQRFKSARPAKNA